MLELLREEELRKSDDGGSRLGFAAGLRVGEEFGDREVMGVDM